jgi:acetyl-CoA carboxylase biotin carboxyl carrier protein
MAESTPTGPDVFDVRKIRRLVELMNEHELSELDLRQGETRIRLRRGADPVVTTADLRPIAPAVQLPPGPDRQPAAAKAEPAADEGKIAMIKSPMVGTFYSAANPESAAFVKVGDHIGPETTVCLIEAMKVFNEIPAETSGQIVAVLADNGEPVEYGQPLFKINLG